LSIYAHATAGWRGLLGLFDTTAVSGETAGGLRGVSSPPGGEFASLGQGWRWP